MILDLQKSQTIPALMSTPQWGGHKDLAIEIKNLGLGITVGDRDPFHSSIMHKIKIKQVTNLL